MRSLTRAARHVARGLVLNRPTLTALGGAIPMEAHVGHANSSKVVYASLPDFAEMQQWARWIEPGSLFVDVGANVGTYSLWAAFHGATVVAVEPDPSVLPLLIRNLDLNPSLDIEVIDSALSDAEGTALLIQRRSGLSALGTDGSTVEVSTRTLDSVLRGRRAGVKLDVEGFERLVLVGAIESLRNHRIRLLQIEWNDTCERAMEETRAPTAELLSDLGYVFKRPDASGALRPASSRDYGRDLFAVAP